MHWKFATHSNRSMDTKLPCLGLHTRKGMFKSGTLKQLNKCVMKLSVLSVSLIRNIGRVAQMSVSFSRSRRSADPQQWSADSRQNSRENWTKTKVDSSSCCCMKWLHSSVYEGWTVWTRLHLMQAYHLDIFPSKRVSGFAGILRFFGNIPWVLRKFLSIFDIFLVTYIE